MIRNGLSRFRQLEKVDVISDLLLFISKELSPFTSSKEFTDILKLKKNENQHTLSYCLYMTNRCKSKYYFARENSQRGSSVVDIGIYNGSILIFTIEAKILPTPNQANRYPHEYVFGRGGGIERFRNGSHGVDNMNQPLLQNGMIAFIMENDFEFWYDQVNEWIVGKWGKSEMLAKDFITDTAKFQSKHRRTADLMILHHFWIKVA